MRAILACAVAVLLAAAADVAATQEFRVAVMAASCNACHGPDGRSEFGMPPLAGRPAQELYDALVGFKSDRRFGLVMPKHAKGYSDEDLRAIAEFYSRIPAKKGPK